MSPCDLPDIGARVWATRNGKPMRAEVLSITGRMARVRSLPSRSRPTQQVTWELRADTLIPIVDSGDVGLASAAAQREIVGEAHAAFARAAEHAAKGRR